MHSNFREQTWNVNLSILLLCMVVASCCAGCVLISHAHALTPARDVRYLTATIFSCQGLQMEERDGFRYYQYDWSVVGGKPTALSTDDIDTALDGAP